MEHSDELAQLMDKMHDTMAEGHLGVRGALHSTKCSSSEPIPTSGSTAARR